MFEAALLLRIEQHLTQGRGYQFLGRPPRKYCWTMQRLLGASYRGNSIDGRSGRPHCRCWLSRPDLGERWPSRLVATAAEERLSFRRTHVVCGSQRLPALAHRAWVSPTVTCGRGRPEDAMRR